MKLPSILPTLLLTIVKYPGSYGVLCDEDVNDFPYIIYIILHGFQSPCHVSLKIKVDIAYNSMITLPMVNPKLERKQ